MHLPQGFIKFHIHIVVNPSLETLEYFIAVIAPHGKDKGKAKLAGVTLVQIRERSANEALVNSPDTARRPARSG